jgi:hypothetical protein
MNQGFDILGEVKVKFLLCENRRNCEKCSLHGDKCRRKRREVMLLEDVIYVLPDDRRLLIKKGFIFDGASIPRFFWRVVGHPLDPEFIRAALLHDGLYASELEEQEECDLLFEEFMEDYDDISWAKRTAMYQAVHWFGGNVWKEHSQESVLNARKYVMFINERGENEWGKVEF